jgi:hypothetical protein
MVKSPSKQQRLALKNERRWNDWKILHEAAGDAGHTNDANVDTSQDDTAQDTGQRQSTCHVFAAREG